MQWQDIDGSSLIKAVGYDDASKTLGVRFQNSQEYHYPNVDPSTRADFVRAESVGKYFHAHIKQLPCEKVPNE
jgi:hypothetical protein